mmetsp:Transcript_22806/g.41236  ORF Transcript_22806/g.41236 Transcript_22806/m.41236 type:complete len:208 (-) Transcript_22806:1351-1974(-)
MVWIAWNNTLIIFYCFPFQTAIEWIDATETCILPHEFINGWIMIDQCVFEPIPSGSPIQPHTLHKATRCEQSESSWHPSLFPKLPHSSIHQRCSRLSHTPCCKHQILLQIIVFLFLWVICCGCCCGCVLAQRRVVTTTPHVTDHVTFLLCAGETTTVQSGNDRFTTLQGMDSVMTQVRPITPQQITFPYDLSGCSSFRRNHTPSQVG